MANDGKNLPISDEYLNEKRADGIRGILEWIVEKAVRQVGRVEVVRNLLGPKICVRFGLEIPDRLTREFLDYLISSGQVRGFLMKDAIQHTLGEDSSLSLKEEEAVAEFYRDLPRKQREYYLQKYLPKARKKIIGNRVAGSGPQRRQGRRTVPRPRQRSA